MDPYPFIGNLALMIPVASHPARADVHPSSPWFCKTHLNKLPYQATVIPLLPPDTDHPPSTTLLAARFYLGCADLNRLAGKSLFAARCRVEIAIYTGRRGTTYDVNSGRLLGKVTMPLDIWTAESLPCIFHKFSCVHDDSLRHFSRLGSVEPVQLWGVNDPPPGNSTRKSWGSLEAWREHGGSNDGLGYLFEILPDTHIIVAGVLLAESTLSGKGGSSQSISLETPLSTAAVAAPRRR